MGIEIINNGTNGHMIEEWTIECGTMRGEAWVCASCEQEVRYLPRQEMITCMQCEFTLRVDIWDEEEEWEEEEEEMDEQMIEWLRKRGRSH